MLIICSLFRHSQYDLHFDRTETRYFGSDRAAQAWIASVLPPVETTRECCDRDLSRAPYVRLEYRPPNAMRGPGLPKLRRRAGFWGRHRPRTIASPCRLVPSVGEKGYW